MGGVTCDQGTRADVSGKKSTVNGKRGGRVCSIELVVFDQLNGCVDDSVLVQQTQPTPYPIPVRGLCRYYGPTTDPLTLFLGLLPSPISSSRLGAHFT